MNDYIWGRIAARLAAVVDASSRREARVARADLSVELMGLTADDRRVALQRIAVLEEQVRSERASNRAH